MAPPIDVPVDSPPVDAPAPDAGTPATNGLLGSYFSNRTLTGTPTLTRVDPTVDFSWNNAAPDPRLPADNFSVRWTGQVQAQKTETYTFSTSTDDGARLWVNGQLLVDNWTDHKQTWNSGTIALIAGQRYDLKMEYYEHNGGAVAKLWWQSPTTTFAAIPQSALFTSSAAGGTDAAAADAPLDAPPADAPPADAPPADAPPPVDSPPPPPPDAAAADAPVDAPAPDAPPADSPPLPPPDAAPADTGGGGPSPDAAPPTNGLLGSYFGNMTLAGSPAFTRVDPIVDFDWGNAAPDPRVGVDGFSVRWAGQLQAPRTESTTITTGSDDGVRLWINGQLVVDNWTDHSWAWNSTTMSLVAGQRYDIRMEYYDHTGGALAKLYWNSASTSFAAIPQSVLWTSSPPAVDAGADSAGPDLPPDVAPDRAPDLAPDVAPDAGVDAVSGPPPSSGLLGTYFPTVDLSGAAAFTRVDAIVDFDWGDGAPDPRLGADNFSVRWTGLLLAPKSETFTITTGSDDGVRVWIGGQLLIDNWTDHGWTWDSANVMLTAGQRYDIRVEYYERTGGSVAKLYWNSPSTSYAPIPQSQLSTGP
jgi:hypothetical protein